jgi:predicted nucleic acid-binding protein
VVLVDSSAWILAEHQKILLSRLLPAGENVATCPMIVQEVLRGTGSPSHYLKARKALLESQMLDSPTPFERFEEAARIFRACRDAGVTPRSSVDCLVVATAIAHDVPLLHDDCDFEHVARVLPLKTIRPIRS